MITLYAAMTKDRVIGKEGSIPWHHPKDLKRFKEFTGGTAVIMGRKTYESIGKPLPDRFNIVLTRDHIPGVYTTSCWRQALRMANQHRSYISIIGGQRVYETYMPLANRMVLTLVPEVVEGDTYFPPIDPFEWEYPIPFELQKGLVCYEFDFYPRDPSEERRFDWSDLPRNWYIPEV